MATEHEALAPVRISFIALFQRNIYQASAAYNIWLAFSVSFRSSVCAISRKKIFSFAFPICFLKEASILIIGYLWFNGGLFYSTS